MRLTLLATTIATLLTAAAAFAQTTIYSNPAIPASITITGAPPHALYEASVGRATCEIDNRNSGMAFATIKCYDEANPNTYTAIQALIEPAFGIPSIASSIPITHQIGTDYVYATIALPDPSICPTCPTLLYVSLTHNGQWLVFRQFII